MKGNTIKTPEGKYRVVDSILTWRWIVTSSVPPTMIQETIYLCVELKAGNTKVVKINPTRITEIY